MAVVKVPKTPKRAFDKNRPPSALLLDQIKHLEWAALPAAQRKPRQLPRTHVQTEQQAAERIEQLTYLVLEEQAQKSAKIAAPGVAPGEFKRVILPPVPRLAAPKRRKKNRKTAAATRRKRATAASSTTRRKRAKAASSTTRRTRSTKSSGRRTRARGKRR